MFGLAEALDRLNAEPAGNAVVQRLGNDFLTDRDQRFVHGHHVADLDHFPGLFAEPQVHDKFLRLRDLLAFFR